MRMNTNTNRYTLRQHYARSVLIIIAKHNEIKNEIIPKELKTHLVLSGIAAGRMSVWPQTQLEMQILTGSSDP